MLVICIYNDVIEFNVESRIIVENQNAKLGNLLNSCYITIYFFFY